MQQQLTQILNDGDAQQNVSRYFQSLYGRHFEAIGASQPSPHRVTADDLVAVQMLSVTIPPAVSAALLLGGLGDELAALLQAIPTQVELRSHLAVTLIDSGSPANAAWQLLRTQDGMGRTKTSKLLARKRPALLPVIDDVVACALGAPTSFWTSMQAALATGHLDEPLVRLRRTSEVPEGVTDLRIIDVAVWTSHQDAHRQCRRGRRATNQA